nr:hypothetical protein [uncultured Cupriavidus sp.]
MNLVALSPNPSPAVRERGAKKQKSKNQKAKPEKEKAPELSGASSLQVSRYRAMCFSQING